MLNAEKNPVYKKLVNNAENEIIHICYDRTFEDTSVDLHVRSCMDAKVAYRLIKRAVNKKNISLGLTVRVSLNESKRLISCVVPSHNIKLSYCYDASSPKAMTKSF